jgi:hypothetical protein
MGFEGFLFGYGKGRNIGRGQSVIQSTPVKLIEGRPSSFNEESLKAICSIPPMGDENLIVTQDYVVYKTDYEFINAIAKGVEMGASRYGPRLVGTFWKHVRNFVTLEDQSMWIPWTEILRAGWDCDQIELHAFLGSNVVPFYYYWLELSSGTIWFIQTPVGRGPGERQFNLMANAFNELL